MNNGSDLQPESRRQMWLEILIFGVACGLLLTALQATEYRLLVVGGRAGAFTALIAALFTGLGLFFGSTLRKRASIAAKRESREPKAEAEAFAVDETRRAELGITPRELEVLSLIAEGLSNREIAERLFVSENTIKTHSSRIFEKLGARRRTQATQLGKSLGLIP